MGRLRDIHIPTTVIETPGGSFAVRGLSFSDLVLIANTHGPQAAMVFQKVTGGEKLTVGDVRSILAHIVPQVPDLAAAVIAMATDDYTPETIQVARRLNFQYQLAALEGILNNTFQSEAELKKFMESVVRMLTTATATVQQIRLPLSEAGFGAFDGK